LDVKAILEETESVPAADPTVVELLKVIKDQKAGDVVPAGGDGNDDGT
jgi:hypothetical protein